ncbi:hypothetical protein BJX65DRAFT_312116 [Aspergillus insuetus]
MNTTRPAHCATQNYTGSTELPYEYYCSLPLRQANNATLDPLPALRGCCEDPDKNLALYGRNNCQAYCNATEETVSDLGDCLMRLLRSREVLEFGCEGTEDNGAGRGRGVALGWAGYLVVGLAVVGVLGV